jgi:hypothetical protein
MGGHPPPLVAAHVENIRCVIIRILFSNKEHIKTINVVLLFNDSCTQQIQLTINKGKRNIEYFFIIEYISLLFYILSRLFSKPSISSLIFLFKERKFFYISRKKLRDSVIPGLRDFSFFLSNTFVYDPILFKLSMNANIVKMQIFHKIKYDLRGHSRSQILTFLIKNLLFLLVMLLIDWRNKCCWTLWKNKVWLIQRWHLPCFDLNLHSYWQLLFYITWVLHLHRVSHCNINLNLSISISC